MGFNLLDNEDFIIPYITDTIPNSTNDHQLPAQAKRNVWIIHINREEPITAQGVIDELNHHPNPRGKYKVKISLCRRKSYQRTYIRIIIIIITLFFILYTICVRNAGTFTIDFVNTHKHY